MVAFNFSLKPIQLITKPAKIILPTIKVVKSDLKIIILPPMLDLLSPSNRESGKGVKTQNYTDMKCKNWQTEWNTRIENPILSVKWNNRFSFFTVKPWNSGNLNICEIIKFLKVQNYIIVIVNNMVLVSYNWVWL